MNKVYKKVGEVVAKKKCSEILEQTMKEIEKDEAQSIESLNRWCKNERKAKREYIDSKVEVLSKGYGQYIKGGCAKSLVLSRLLKLRDGQNLIYGFVCGIPFFLFLTNFSYFKFQLPSFFSAFCFLGRERRKCLSKL